ncbi:MAG: hypothetical protein AAF551_07790 [Bacteroidota bacterium]
MKITVLLISLVFGSFCFAQNKDEGIPDYIPTENLDKKKDANSASLRSKKKRYDVIYRPSAKNILYGNPCAVEATHKMGFEYLVEPRGISGSKSQKGKFVNNLWVKTKLVLRRSPFWKLILKKRFKKCRRMSGDFVG